MYTEYIDRGYRYRYICILHLCYCFYPRILIFLVSCARSCILASLYPHILRFIYFRYLLVSSHPHILISLGLCMLACDLVSIFLSLGSCTLCACCYPRILISSYPQIHVLCVLVGILASSHPHTLRFMQSGFLLVPSHLHIPIPLTCIFF